jgi:phosphoglucosamine mutase
VLLMCARHWQAPATKAAIVATVMSNIVSRLRCASRASTRTLCGRGQGVMEEMIKRILARRRAVRSHHLFRAPHRRRHRYRAERAACDGRERAGTGRSRVAAGDGPQVLVNVRVREKQALTSVPSIAAAMGGQTRLAGQGRLLVRYSGTEPLLRVMIEGRTRTDSGLGGRDRRSCSRTPWVEPGRTRRTR